MWGRLGNTSGEAIYVTRGTTAADLGTRIATQEFEGESVACVRRVYNDGILTYSYG